MAKKKQKGRQIRVDRACLSEKSRSSGTIPEFYEDETYTCVDCGRHCTFPAETQKDWYEVKKRYFFQRPIRCATCHGEWVKQRHAKFQMDRKLQQLKENPENPNLMAECACAIVDFHQSTERGNLDLALHLFRSSKSRSRQIREAIAYCEENV